MICNKCSSPMVEKELFVSKYWHCNTCDDLAAFEREWACAANKTQVDVFKEPLFTGTVCSICTRADCKGHGADPVLSVPYTQPRSAPVNQTIEKLTEAYKEALPRTMAPGKFEYYYLGRWVGRWGSTQDQVQKLPRDLPEDKAMRMPHVAGINNLFTNPSAPSVPEGSMVINNGKTYIYERGGWVLYKYSETNKRARAQMDDAMHQLQYGMVVGTAAYDDEDDE